MLNVTHHDRSCLRAAHQLGSGNLGGDLGAETIKRAHRERTRHNLSSSGSSSVVSSHSPHSLQISESDVGFGLPMNHPQGAGAPVFANPVFCLVAEFHQRDNGRSICTFLFGKCRGEIRGKLKEVSAWAKGMHFRVSVKQFRVQSKHGERLPQLGQTRGAAQGTR